MESTRVQNLKKRQWSSQHNKNKQKLKVRQNKIFDDFSTTTDEASSSFSFESNTTEINSTTKCTESFLKIKKDTVFLF